ncbi:hypothetical protein J4E90_005517 [Alternaria incomplexa]|uniref:uncharacterized protein n=1 Tax=Alternaria incomplexa TaxID=1187928 RepID=UPI00221FA64F|nr:uncharacterized protein J4E90_005517 [Alternaria incomplexa]KAI4913797.1 hypothetical protein J4E90_005517 [Alternaria incomplexa]
MAPKSLLFLASSLKLLASARDVTFPPISGYSSQQIIAHGNLEMDIAQAKFAGLMTYANLPYVHCLAAEGHDVEPFDIAILGAPFDTHNSGVNHGTFLHIAHEEGLIRNTSIHVGIRAPVVRPKGDVRNDLRCGFEMVKARAIDRLGVAGIIDKLKSRVAGTKVYISVDIDVLDPAFAPGKLSNKTCQK